MFEPLISKVERRTRYPGRLVFQGNQFVPQTGIPCDRELAAPVTRLPEITERHVTVQTHRVEPARHILGRAALAL
ncbi:hypothetical protein ACFRIB_54355 [Streptomyces mirabilis]|uniref:hypothetical protein n=1 Tax=Streptomyces mirabilis TaxID=68239 RepID=UPI0036B40D28